MKPLSQENRGKFLEDMKNPSVHVMQQWEPTYNEFLDKSAYKNAAFAFHSDIMSHCDEILAFGYC